MPNETVVKNSIKIFSSKYRADLSYDIDSSYVLNFNFVTSFKSELKRVFSKDEPMTLSDPVEDISGVVTIIPKGLKRFLACLLRVDESAVFATSHGDINEFHIVANCFDKTAENNYVGYYAGYCQLNETAYPDFSDITEPVTFKFSAGELKTALGAFDVFSVDGTNSANQEVTFNYTPVLHEGRYAVKVFKDNILLIKDTDYSEDISKITVFSPVAVASKITVLNIYNR
ncbi:hypothetical protein ACFL2A_00615 [Thermodesulfobacteriota bacterium]